MERSLSSRSDEAVNSMRVPVRSYPWWQLQAGLGVLFLVCIASLGFGSAEIPARGLWMALWGGLSGSESVVEPRWSLIVWEIRLPRILLAALTGAALAVSGATYQGLFRNPLADPYLVGVASGAGLGAAIVLATGLPETLQGLSTVPLAAFIGGLAAVLIAYSVARRGGGLPNTILILAGVAVASLCSALTSLLMLRSDPDVRHLLVWLMGGFGAASWSQLKMVFPYILVSSIILLLGGRTLNILQLDEEEARQLGVSVDRSKRVLVSAASLATAAAVSVSGLIGFVGLIAPHVVRLIWGYDYRFLLPMSMIVGAGFLLVADVAARTVLSPGELPVGIVTALCGVPFFLYLLRR